MFAGVIGVGVGFGMQNLVKNFIGGILLFVERPVKTGDILDVSNHNGVLVKRIGIRFTIVETSDSKELMIPNSKLVSNGFVNWTYTDQIVRITMYINISYDYEPHQVKRIIQNVLDKTPGVLSEPKSWVVLSDLNEAKMKFRIDYYLDIRYANWIKLKSDVLFKIWESLKKAGISM